MMDEETKSGREGTKVDNAEWKRRSGWRIEQMERGPERWLTGPRNEAWPK